MEGETSTMDKTCTFLCWLGAEEKLEHALSDLPEHNGWCLNTPSEFLEAFQETSPRFVVLSGKPVSEAVKLLRAVKQRDDSIPAFVVLDNPDPDEVRGFLLKGAENVFWIDELPSALPLSGTVKASKQSSVSDSLPEPGEIVCVNPVMQKVVGVARRIAPTDSTVLIQGECGTGKELVASLIHSLSRRKDKPFVKVNCGAIPEPLLESQLYGHEKGSFTGAVKRQKGLFEAADGGTIFLDEIGELGFELQVKLLRFLQNREFRRVGGHEVLKVNVRVIAATNRNLGKEVENGRFRTDLFYRLNIIDLYLPPLRERPEEMPILVDHFMQKAARKYGISPKNFTPEAVASIRRLSWPGNIRQLENVVEKLLLLSQGGEIGQKEVQEHVELPEEYNAGPQPGGSTETGEVGQGQEPNLTPVSRSPAGEPAFPTLAEVERAHIHRVLTALEWNKMRTARTLGINVKTLYNKIRAYRLKQAKEVTR